MQVRQSCCRYLMNDGTQCPNTKTQDSDFCEQHANWLHADLQVYRAITEHFRQDVREFWTRSNFYLLVQAGLLSVFATLLSLKTSSYSKAMFVAFGILGLVIGIIWFIVSKGAVHWIRRWREQAIALDNIVDRHKIYERVESFAASSPLMSPSNVTQYVPIVFCIAWLVLLCLLPTFL
jgi:hypothetical protein